MKQEFFLWTGLCATFAFVAIAGYNARCAWSTMCISLGIGLVLGSAITWHRWGNGRVPLP